MSNHSVIEHRANYHFLKVEEDYLAICSVGKESPHCKAMILAILEHWTNSKRDTDQSDFIYLSLPEWVDQTYESYARNVIINCLKELMDMAFIERRPIKRYDQDTFAYRLNIEVVQAAIRALPEKISIKPNLAAYRELQEQKRVQREAERKAKEGSLKINGGVVEKSTASKNKLPPVEKSTASRSGGSLKKDYGPLKNQRNIDTNLDSSLPSDNVDTDGAANADTTPRTREKLEGVSPIVNPASRFKPARHTPDTAPAVILSEQEQAFYDLYCSMPWIKLPPAITAKVKEQCASYARVFQTQEQLFSLKNWMQRQDYFKGKGFSLSLMGLAVNDWSMEQVEKDAPAAPTTSRYRRLEVPPLPLAAGGAR